jgi:hypothetical protein
MQRVSAADAPPAHSSSAPGGAPAPPQVGASPAALAVPPAAPSPLLSARGLLCSVCSAALALLLGAVAVPVWLNVDAALPFDARSATPPAWATSALSGARGGDVDGGELRVSAASAWRAASLRVRYTRRVRCSACGGAGGHGRAPCGDCGGSGAALARTPFGLQRVRCGRCSGTGAVIARRCAVCGGAGARAVAAEAAVAVSPGLRGGDAVRVVGAGDDAGGGGQAGMLAVSLRDDFADFPHLTRCAPASRACAAHEPDAERMASHLRATVELSLREALLGFSRALPHPRDAGAGVAVASAGVTQPGAVLVVRGAGLPLRTAWFRARTARAAGGAAGAAVELQSADELGEDGDALRVAAAAARAPLRWRCAARALLPGWLLAPRPAGADAAAAADDDDCAAAPAAEYGDLLVEVRVALPRALDGATRRAVARAFEE